MIEMLIMKLTEMDKFWDSWFSNWNNNTLVRDQAGDGVTPMETEEEGVTEEDAEITEGAENEKEEPDKTDEGDEITEPDDNEEDLVEKPIEGDVDVPTEELLDPAEEEESEVPDDLPEEEPPALDTKKRLRRKRKM